MGYIAQCHPSLLDRYDIKQPVVVTEVLDLILNLIDQPITYTPFSRFPSTRRDIALIVPNDLTYSDILIFLNKYKHKMVVDIGVFDVFESESIGKDKKSIGIYLTYQDMGGTLSDEKVNKAHDRLCKRLIADLPVTIR